MKTERKITFEYKGAGSGLAKQLPDKSFEFTYDGELMLRTVPVPDSRLAEFAAYQVAYLERTGHTDVQVLF